MTLRCGICSIKAKHAWIKDERGKGLLNAVEVNPHSGIKLSGWDICLRYRLPLACALLCQALTRIACACASCCAHSLKDHGLLAKQTHDHIIRFAPPLVISEEQLDEAFSIIEKVFNTVD